MAYTPKGKIDWDNLSLMMKAWQSGGGGHAPYSLSGGQPRTWTPGPQPFVPYMPQAVQSAPVTFQPSGVNLGMGPTMPMPQPQMSAPLPMTALVGRRPMKNLGLGKVR